MLPDMLPDMDALPADDKPTGEPETLPETEAALAPVARMAIATRTIVRIENMMDWKRT
jgi:hypothetical protein